MERYDDDELKRGNKLFCEAAAALLEDLDSIAANISPEEAEEFKDIFNKISEMNDDGTFKYDPFTNDDNAIAAEEDE